MIKNLISNAACESAVKSIAEGDINALSVIYDHMYRQIYSVSWAILKNHMDAEDNLQNTLCEIVKCAASYKKGNARAWIIAIARNTALNFAKAKRSCFSLEDYENDTLSVPPDSPFDSVICFDALNSLSDEEREIIVLKIYAGLKHKEIAALLNITAASAEKKYQRALRKLKEYF